MTPTTVAAIATPLVSRRTPENAGVVEDGTTGTGIGSGPCASRERSSTRATSPSKTSRRDFRFQGGFGTSVARLDGVAETSFAGEFFGSSVFDNLPSLDSRTGTPMIPSILRLAVPLSQALRYIELSVRKNWGTKGLNRKGAINRIFDKHPTRTICVRDTEVASATRFASFFGSGEPKSVFT
jgi:hypothetical protein